MDLKYKRIRELREDHDLSKHRSAKKSTCRSAPTPITKAASAWSRRKSYAVWAIYIM